MSEVSVNIDNRVRLVSAVLAASHWPEMEQAQTTHAVHPQAKMTRQYVADFRQHPAVITANTHLEAGLDQDLLFAAALRSQWPTFEAAEEIPAALAKTPWLAQLADFYTDSAIAAFFWADQEPAWQEAAADLQAIFKDNKLPRFCQQLLGRPLDQRLVIVPNLVYPALSSIVVNTADTLYLIIPPPRAVGESPPWPYGEDPGWVLAESCRQLNRFLLAAPLAQMGDRQQALLQHGAVVLFLEEAVDEAEAMSYLVRSKKQHNLPELPQAVETLRQHLAESHGGIEDLTL